MRKVHIIAIAAVLIIAAGWGGYWLKSNQGKNEKLKLDNLETTDNQLDELSKDWKTYRSEKLGFEIKYPQIFKDIYEYDNFVDMLGVKVSIKNRDKQSREKITEEYFLDSDEGTSMPFETYKIIDTSAQNRQSFQVLFDSDTSGEIQNLILNCIEYNNKVYIIFVGKEYFEKIMTEYSKYNYKDFSDFVFSTFKIIN